MTKLHICLLRGVHAGEIWNQQKEKKLLSFALLPAIHTDQWKGFCEQTAQTSIHTAIADIELIEAPNERIESLSIALCLREALEDSSQTVALVTPNRNLTRRVANELLRFGIEVDDSAGYPLVNTLQASFMFNLLLVALEKPDKVRLGSLLKHPLTRFGLAPSQAERAGWHFELAVLRGKVSTPSPGNYCQAIRMAQKQMKNAPHIPNVLRRMDEKDWENLVRLGTRDGSHIASFTEIEA